MIFRQINITNVTEMIQESLTSAMEIDSPVIKKEFKVFAENTLAETDTRKLEVIIAKEFSLQFVDHLKDGAE